MSVEKSAATAERVHLRCPHCSANFSAKASLAGQTRACPNCQQQITIPGGACPVPETPAPETPAPETPAPETPAPETPAPETPAPETTAPSSPEQEPGTAPEKNDRPSVVFADDGGTYCFELPTPGWLRLQPDDELAMNADIGVIHPDIGMIKFVVSPWPMSLTDLTAGLEKTYAAEVRNFQLLGKADKSVAGVASVGMDYEGQQRGRRTRFRAFLFIKEEYAYQIIAWGDPVTFPRLKKEVAVLLRTFSFDGKRVRVASGAQSSERAPLPSVSQRQSPDVQKKELEKKKSSGKSVVIGWDRSPVFLNSVASVARDIRIHTNSDAIDLKLIEWAGRWWFPMMFVQFGLGKILTDLNSPIIALIVFLGAFLWPVAAYQWLPLFLRDTLRTHLKKETGSFTPDPDFASDDPLRHTGSKPMLPIQDTLNRHWGYHERKAKGAGIAIERVKGGGALRDIFLPIVVGLLLLVCVLPLLW